jgi:hypothetical protein
MTSRFLVLTLMGCIATATLEGADRAAIPATMPKDRYQPMIMRSPFSVATPAAEPSAPSFTEKLFVMGLAKLANEDMVTISSRGNSDRPFTLVGTDDEFEGISLVSVKWSDEVGKSRVTLKKGSEVGVIQFNEAVIKAPIAVTPPAGKHPPRPRTGPSRPTVPPSNVTSPPGSEGGSTDRRVRRIRRPGDR